MSLSAQVAVVAKLAKQEATQYKGKGVELKCDLCDAWLGYVFERDLSGSYFYCGDCGGGK